MAAGAGRILTTHVGRLDRPDELLAFIVFQQEGKPYDIATYQECLQRSVADVVKKQTSVGVDIVSDGEYGKSSWTPIKYTGQALIQRDISDVKRAATGNGAVDAFLPLVAPASVVPQRTDEHYKSEDDARFAIAVRIAKLVGCERVVASTDCGFAHGPFARRVHPQIMWAKLGALAEGAGIATKKIWN